MSFLTEWATHILAEGMAQRTAHDWPKVVLRCARDTASHPLHLSTAAIAGWLAGFQTPNTRATYYSALHAWHEWLNRTGRREDNPMAVLRRPRVPRGVPHPVSTPALGRLLASPLTTRTRAAIVLAAYAGLRVHEIAKFRGEHIDRDEGTLRVNGKGGVVAVLPAPDALLQIADTMPTAGWWFPSPRFAGKPVQPIEITKRIGAAMRRAEISGTAHSLRHWYATTLIRSGAPATVVRDLMRHASLATTQIYCEVNADDKRAAVDRLPLSGLVPSERDAS